MSWVGSWRDVSIARKLYFVVGIMAFLIVGELITLRLAMHTLSAARAFVGGEGLWSKSQKNAAINLQRYGRTKDPADFASFLADLQVPEGDSQARIELFKPAPNLSIVREGLLRGRIDPGDIDPMIDLLRRFSRNRYLSRAIVIWTQADDLLSEFKTAGLAYRSAVIANDAEAATARLADIKRLNERLTVLEDEFSYVLGAGSRWIEYAVLTLLSLAVLLVESVGLTLTFLTSRSISRGLNELNATALVIGEGNFSGRVTPRSRDEIGQLARSVNQMGEMLGRSYAELEVRVKERTAELEGIARENARLYEVAENALRAREDFLSIASHELKTPLTALRLQLQMAQHKMSRDDLLQRPPDGIARALESSERQVARLTRLVEDLMDVSRIRAGKMKFVFARVNVSEVVRDVVDRFEDQLTAVGSTLTMELEDGVVGSLDQIRTEQIIDNLLVNVLKYAPGKPVRVSLGRTGEVATLVVDDRGPGIAEDKQQAIFERFERGDTSNSAGGLGLGLFIVKELVTGQGGSIRVQSRVGEGARFIVELPLHRELQ
ncbi:MAG TPA: HAMP domain-containing sensor histidine kinase [Polyangia bacterium]|nr:HAMP domain-containing sensor histidine kinase [Polyangia bacterium]